MNTFMNYFQFKKGCLLFVCYLLLGVQFTYGQKTIEEQNEEGVKIWIEAENGIIHSPMRIWDDNKASAGSYIEVESGNGSEETPPVSGHAIYEFSVSETGLYKIWGRVIASMDDEDAFWIKVDNDEMDTPVENPVREAYFKFFHNSFCNRPSWDQVAVLYGVRGLSDYFEMKEIGTGRLSNGYSYNMKNNWRTYLETVLPGSDYEDIINGLMIQSPKNN